MSAVSEKRVWILGEENEVRGYLEALSDFPELELSFRGSLAAAEPVTSRPPPHMALVCGEEHRIEPLVQLLAAGTDLWIESPLAANPDDANILAALAEAGDRTLMSGTPLAHAPIWKTALMALRDGRIGELRRVEWRAPIKSPRANVQALEPRALLTALEILEKFAGPVEALRVCWDPNGAGAELNTRHAHQVEGLAQFHDRRQGASTASLTCRGDMGELWIGDAQSVLHDDRGAHQIASGICEQAAFSAVIRALLRRRLGSFIEDRGAWLLQRVTDSLLNAEKWRPA